MSDLIEAMAQAMALDSNDYAGPVLQWACWTDSATAALAALRETHHLVPRATGDDGELVERLLNGAAFDVDVGYQGVSAWVNETSQQAADRITALSAEVERLRGLFAGLAIDADACAVARQYARAALGAKP
jgi:hypothetical protein